MSTPTVSTSGRGAVISIAIAGANPTFTVINGAKTVSFSGPKANYDSTTNLSSPGGIEEFQSTTIDPGTATLSIIWNQVDPGQLLLDANFYAQTLCTVKVQYSAQSGLTNGPVKTFNCYVAENGLPSLDISKVNEFTVQLKITGVITETQGS